MTENNEQVRAALAALRNFLEDRLLAVYLHGSAVSGGLRPQSDFDLLAVVERGLTGLQRDGLLASLLQLSGRHPAASGGPRCLEVIVFRRAELAGNLAPARAEFIYGEWLRDGFEAGEKPVPTLSPEFTLLLAQARREALSLFGPGADELLPAVPLTEIHRAMRELLPALLEGLQGDERNVLLTLARMWHTANTGQFVTKDAAAAWASLRIHGRDAATLDYARKAYLGEITGDWRGRAGAAQRLAKLLGEHVAFAAL